MANTEAKYLPVATKSGASLASSSIHSDVELRAMSNDIDDKEEVMEVEMFANHHKNLGDGGFRAAILGFSDGMTSNLLLILGIQFALSQSVDIDEAAETIVETGFAGLVASSFSMGIGEWISMKNQSEALKGEVQTQQSHLDEYWDEESNHFMKCLAKHGITAETQKMVENDLKEAPKNKVIEFQLQMELGIDPNDTGNPLKAAGFSAMFVAIGSFVPILPYTFAPPHIAWILALCFGIFCGGVLGFITGRISGINTLKTSLRQVLGIGVVVCIALVVNTYLVSLVPQ